LRMLYGAMDQLTVGEPWQLDTDVGPIITKDAHHTIQQHIDAARQKGRLLKHLPTPETERFIGPAVIQIDGIKDLEAEIFGPVLHVATFKAHQLDHILEDINTSGYGLTFGLHTRIDGRIDAIRKRLRVGNMYVNRNQIGAVVESQPFGGEGLSGTGPKAGGPHYVDRFKGHSPLGHTMEAGPVVDHDTLQAAVSRQPDGSDTALHTRIMRGPTGELNQWSTHPRGTVLCLGPTREDAMHQMRTVQAMGCGCVGVAPGLTGAGTCDGVLAAQSLARLEGIHLAVFWGTADQARAYRTALAARSGPIIPLVTDPEFATACLIERHLCVDITAVGGNTDLMA
ncbi:MAG: aldehyde dehydrogenase family protein, partial [Paracoccaceae bacterium]